MPNRQTTDNNYRYAFQGQEKDGETGMEAFELRLWDGRIGRWLTIDPYHEFYSPYVGMGNNPINLVDPDGGSTKNEYDWDVSKGTFKQVSNKGGDEIDYINVIVAGEKQFTIVKEVIHSFKTISNGSEIGYTFHDRTPGHLDVTVVKPTSGALYDPSADIFLAYAGEKVAGEIIGIGFNRIKKVFSAPKVVNTSNKLYSEATFNAFKKQLAKDGIKSILKTQSRIHKNLAEHIQKLAEIKKAGGYSSSVEREIKTFQSQLAAIEDLLK